MSCLCSFILPSRSRPYGLHVALTSIFRQAADPKDIEVIVGLDEDDEITLRRISEFNAYPGAQLHIKPRYHLYQRIEDMAALAQGEWITFWNDDASIIGMEWDNELRRHPTEGVILQPEIHRLGGSTYVRDTGSAFPFCPRKYWDENCAGKTPHPVDHAIPQIALKLGWKIDFIVGMTAFHDKH